MVDGVGAPPEIIRREREHAEHASDPVVGMPLAKEGAVSAIMLDHEKADQEACRRQGEQEAEPVAEAQGRPHQHPEQDERPGRDRELENTPPAARLAVARKELRPSAGVGCPCGGAGT